LHEGFAARGLDQVFGSVRELIAASQEVQARGNTRQIEALLVNPRVSGFLVTQLNDVAWEFHAGILDPWRKPKRTYDAVKRLNQPDCLILRASAAVVTTGDRVDVTLTLIQRVPAEAAEEVVVTVFGPNGKELAHERHHVPPGAGIKELGDISFATGDGPGEYQIVARLLRNREPLAETTESVLVLSPPDWTEFPDTIAFVGASPPGAETGTPWVHGQTVPMEGIQTRLVVAPQPGSLGRDEWDALLAAVAAGGVGVIGPLRPEDELARSILADQGVKVHLHFGIGNWMGCYHWIPAADVFEGLPAGGLAGEAYADVLPHYVLSELGGRVFAGSLRNTQTRREAPAMIWYSDIEAIPFGSGTLVFCQYRIFDRARSNPLAGRLLCNLVPCAETL